MKPLLSCPMALLMLVGCVANAPAPPRVANHDSVPATASAAPTQSSTASTPGDFKIPTGYRQAIINGQERFCRKNIVTGTRVSNGEVCLTAAQIKTEQEQSQKFAQGVQRAGANKSGCVGGPMGTAPAC